VYEVVRRRTENVYSNRVLFQPALLIAYIQACTTLQAVAAVSQDVTFGLSIGTDISEEPSASNYVIVQKMGLKGFLRNVVPAYPATVQHIVEDLSIIISVRWKTN